MSNASAPPGDPGDVDELFSVNNEQPIFKVKAREGSAITKLSEPLNENNWIAW